MAKIVVSGCSDCPYFAKVELLADQLKVNCPNFQVHKIVKTRKEWNAFAQDLAKSNNWNVRDSPIIWRELVDRGGKGYLIGGANEFQEYIRSYYGVMSNLTSEQMQNIAKDNVIFKEAEDREIIEYKALSVPSKVCIFGAANYIVPHFIVELASGRIIDKLTELSLIFLDKEENMTFLKSLQMGTFDLAYTLVRSISITEDVEAAMADCSYVIIFDDMKQLPLESLEVWLKRCKEHYEYLGYVIEKYCLSNVKVLLVPDSSSNLINASLACIHTMLRRIPKFNVVGLSRPFEQHARSIVSQKLSVNPSNVHNIIVWGNIGGKKWFDISNCRVHRYNGSIVGPEPFSLASEKSIWDKRWLKNELEAQITQRFAKVTELRRGEGSALAVSNALSTFLRQWINGDKSGYIHSLVVASDGRYGVPEGMVFSMPVTLNPPGYWTMVQDSELSEFQFKRITECIQDINEQMNIMYPMRNNNQAEMTLEVTFVESQLNALLEEVYPKERLGALRRLLNDSLSLEEKLDVSKSKELLLRTVSDLERPPKPKEVIQPAVIPDPKVENIEVVPEATNGNNENNENEKEDDEKVTEDEDTEQSVNEDNDDEQ